MKRLLIGLIGLGTLVGCTPDEEKVKRVVENAIQQCKEAEGDFAEVEVVGGTDAVLKDTCDAPIGDVELKDEFHASAKVGPYVYLVGIDSETGVWVLTQVDWEALNEARRHLAGDDPPKDARERAEAALAKAQQELPESAWIRKARFENLLELRETERGKSDDPVALGDAAQGALDESIAWARENSRPEVAAELRVLVVDYYTDYASKLEMAFDNIGSGDEHLEALINQARKDGNKEDEEKYRATLEESLAGRDAEIATMTERIATSRKRACEFAAQLDPAGLDGALRDQVVAVKENTSCSPSVQAEPNAAGEEGGEEE